MEGGWELEGRWRGRGVIVQYNTPGEGGIQQTLQSSVHRTYKKKSQRIPSEQIAFESVASFKFLVDEFRQAAVAQIVCYMLL